MKHLVRCSLHFPTLPPTKKINHKVKLQITASHRLVLRQPWETQGEEVCHRPVLGHEEPIRDKQHRVLRHLLRLRGDLQRAPRGDAFVRWNGVDVLSWAELFQGEMKYKCVSGHNLYYKCCQIVRV